MARLSGVELNDNWKIDYALTRLKGIGWPLSERLLGELKMDGHTRMKELSAEDLSKLGAKLEEFQIEGELIRLVRGNITRLQNIGSYRGLRHSRGLPSRGQRTRRNARTRRGKRKTVGAFKKEALAKQAAPAAKAGK
jgi:small subunit ribosomal protein S13